MELVKEHREKLKELEESAYRVSVKEKNDDQEIKELKKV